MYASEHYFKEHFYKVVEPDSAQKVKLDAILKQYSEEFNEMNTAFRKDFESLMDRQWNDIKPVLNKEQIEKLEEIERIRRERMKEFRQRDDSEERDRHDRGQERGRRPPGFRDSLPNPPDRRTDSL